MDGISTISGSFQQAFSFKRSISATMDFSHGGDAKKSRRAPDEPAIVNVGGMQAQSGEAQISDKKDADLELLKKTFGIKDPGEVLSAESSNGQENGGGAEKTADQETDAGATGQAPAPSNGNQAEVQVDASFEMSASVSISQQGQIQQSDPLALDLTGEGIKTTGVENGAAFDINADGKLDKTSYVAGGSAFLALDRNGDGVINDGSELFGDQNGASNGFEELARYDQNKDGWIDSKDQVYANLRLAANEGADPFAIKNMKTLEQAGVAAIRLNYAQTAASYTSGGDSIAQTGTFIRSDGSRGMAGDLMLSKISLTA